MIPTKRVRRKDGHTAIINASDFDPAEHEDLDAETAPPPKPKGKAKPAPAPEPEIGDEEDTGV